jgi:hypothetical protein
VSIRFILNVRSVDVSALGAVVGAVAAAAAAAWTH